VLAPLYSLVTEHWGADAGVNTLVYALALIAVGLWLPGGIWPKLRSWSVGVRGKLGMRSRAR
jgi:ABC-type branched-subunit amino acid transport system permease subunit